MYYVKFWYWTLEGSPTWNVMSFYGTCSNVLSSFLFYQMDTLRNWGWPPVTWARSPLIGQYWSRDLNTGLWLVSSSSQPRRHPRPWSLWIYCVPFLKNIRLMVTWQQVLASDWSRDLNTGLWLAIPHPIYQSGHEKINSDMGSWQGRVLTMTI